MSASRVVPRIRWSAQRISAQKFETYNIAPTWTRLINPSLVFTLGGFVRHDGYNYYPSENPYADLGPLQSETVAQNRNSDERRRPDVLSPTQKGLTMSKQE